MPTYSNSKWLPLVLVISVLILFFIYTLGNTSLADVWNRMVPVNADNFTVEGV